MVSNSSTLFGLLNRYACRELTMGALHDQLSLGFQKYFDNASEEGIEIFSEVLSAIYEVADGALGEEEFRRAVKELVKSRVAPKIITVGNPPPRNYHPYSLKTSTSSANFNVAMKAA